MLNIRVLLPFRDIVLLVPLREKKSTFAGQPTSSRRAYFAFCSLAAGLFCDYFCFRVSVTFTVPPSLACTPRLATW